MRSFMYTIKAPVGMHARHAGLLVRETSRYQSDITLTKGDRSVNANARQNPMQRHLLLTVIESRPFLS